MSTTSSVGVVFTSICQAGSKPFEWYTRVDSYHFCTRLAVRVVHPCRFVPLLHAIGVVMCRVVCVCYGKCSDSNDEHAGFPRFCRVHPYRRLPDHLLPRLTGRPYLPGGRRAQRAGPEGVDLPTASSTGVVHLRYVPDVRRLHLRAKIGPRIPAGPLSGTFGGGCRLPRRPAWSSRRPARRFYFVEAFVYLTSSSCMLCEILYALCLSRTFSMM